MARGLFTDLSSPLESEDRPEEDADNDTDGGDGFFHSDMIIDNTIIN